LVNFLFGNLMATNNAINLKSAGIASYDAAGLFTALANPLTVSNGGTGDNSLLAYAVICGGTVATGALQTVASVGVAGQALTSGGAGVLPSFQNLPSGSNQATFVTTATAGDPADGITYFFKAGASFTAETGVTNAGTRFYSPIAGTLNIIYGVFKSTATGTNQNCTLSIRLNNTTDTVILNNIQLTAATVTFNKTNLGITINAGDFISFKFISPSWLGNPTGVSFSATAIIT
jgi:hypothetical protein